MTLYSDIKTSKQEFAPLTCFAATGPHLIGALTRHQNVFISHSGTITMLLALSTFDLCLCSVYKTASESAPPPVMPF